MKFYLSIGAALACTVAVAGVTEAAAAAAPSGWPAYGGDAGGTRYSPLEQINATNVADLRVAWEFRTGELGDGVKDWSRSAFEVTPIRHRRELRRSLARLRLRHRQAALGDQAARGRPGNTDDVCDRRPPIPRDRGRRLQGGHDSR